MREIDRVVIIITLELTKQFVWWWSHYLSSVSVCLWVQLIPVEFSRDFLEWKHQTAKLIQVADNIYQNNKSKKEWFVEVKKQKTKAKMYMGKRDWPKFEKANHLQLEDVCTFEVIDVHNNLLVLNDSISRSS